MQSLNIYEELTRIPATAVATPDHSLKGLYLQVTKWSFVNIPANRREWHSNNDDIIYAILKVSQVVGGSRREPVTDHPLFHSSPSNTQQTLVNASSTQWGWYKPAIYILAIPSHWIHPNIIPINMLPLLCLCWLFHEIMKYLFILAWSWRSQRYPI